MMRKLLAGVFISAFVFCGLVWADDFVLVEQGKSDVKIVLPRELTKALGEQTREFAESLKKATGAEYPVVDKATGGRCIVLAVDPKPGDDAESFRFTFPEAGVLRISGATKLGLTFALNDFLERYVGYRWLFPGPDGECIPDAGTVRIPMVEVVETPAFLSRYLGMGAFRDATRPFYLWMREKLKANNYRIMHGENMYLLFPGDKYGQEHPEFYPVFHGKRYIPKKGEHSFWQPCYTQPALAEEAIRSINARMKATTPNPENLRAYTFSLGVNDSAGFCECEECLKADASAPANPFGRKGRSCSFLGFANKVAAGVAKEYPQARLGFIAYTDVTAPPKESFRLHPNLVPHLCVELFQWADPQRRQLIEKLYQDWQDVGAREMGWYDYAWGRGYMLPRLYLHSFADVIRTLHAHGVRHYRAEFGQESFWYEGPKAYVMLKLLWNPAADVDALLDDWYEHAVGKAAAPYLKAYFDNLEKFWTESAVKSSWFEAKPTTYLKSGNTGYLAVYPPEALDNSRKLLEKALALAETPAQKARAQHYLDDLRKYTPIVRKYQENLRLREAFEKITFDKVVKSYTFDSKPFTLSTWRRNDKTRVEFRREEAGGVDHTAALVIDLSLSKRAPGSYVAYMPHPGGGGAYRASVMARTDGNTSEGGQVSIGMQWRDNKKKVINKALNSTTLHPCPRTGEWRELVVYGKAPEEPGILSIALTGTLSDGGIVYFDNLKVETTSQQ